MKAYRKGKIDSSEFHNLKEIRFNYHKFMWTKFKIKIRKKRFKIIK